MEMPAQGCMEINTPSKSVVRPLEMLMKNKQNPSKINYKKYINKHQSEATNDIQTSNFGHSLIIKQLCYASSWVCCTERCDSSSQSPSL
ncbi:hypothetical protein, partial [Comamonas testosteroni]|uniref:hypothetical protein n=1 Tax=Comamonas testosteroni TaxID=285 RepID=UPI001E59590D